MKIDQTSSVYDIFVVFFVLIQKQLMANHKGASL